MVICRLKHGQRVTGGRILYVNKRHHSKVSLKKSQPKRIHLLFDDDGNAIDADSEPGSVTERLLEDNSVDEMIWTGPLFAAEADEDCMETICSDEKQTEYSNDKIGNSPESINHC